MFTVSLPSGSCRLKRYEQAATLITSNFDSTEWDQAFPGNPLLAAVTLDHFRYNAYASHRRRSSVARLGQSSDVRDGSESFS
jgi:DNA replication protein DnaC